MLKGMLGEYKSTTGMTNLQKKVTKSKNKNTY